ncbi:MAG: DUF2804 domain-containing protein [Myxococcota bacterium]|nr:DUF2804 domain-containing protein [Myxococcota bacterium]
MAQLINAEGRPNFGVYGGDVGPLNMWDYTGLPRWKKNWRAKRWRFVGLFSPSLVTGVAVVDVGYSGSTFAYGVDMDQNLMAEFHTMTLLGRHIRISDHSTDGEATYEKGKTRIQLTYRSGGDVSRVDVYAPTDNGILEIEAVFDESHTVALPHQIVTPTPGGRWVYTHKAAGMPASGRAVINGRTIDFPESATFAAVDHTVGYHDYHWEWRWASLGGLANDGRRVGLNLVDPIHDPVNQENALWVDGRRYPLHRARFERDQRDVIAPWRVTTLDGTVDLAFRPQCARKETINLGIVKSCYAQPIGVYSGTIQPPVGEKLTLTGIPGVAEDHDARW